MNRLIPQRHCASLITFVILTFISLNLFAVNNEDYEKALESFHNKAYKTSIIHLKAQLQSQPKHLSSRVLLAENYLALNQGQNAETELLSAQQGGASQTRLSPLFARAFLQQNKFSNVLEILSPRSNDLQLKSEILAYRGLAYLGLKQFSQAQQAFDNAIELVPVNTNALLGQAKLLLTQDKANDAIKFIEKARAIKPDDIHTLLMAAITYKLLDKPDEALVATNALLSIEPVNYSALLVRATLNTERGNTSAATTDLDQIIKALPNEPISHYIKLLSLSNTEDLETSSKLSSHIASIISGIPEDTMKAQPIYYFLAGIVYFKQQSYENAEKHFLKYSQAFPNDIKIMKLLARTKMALSEPVQAKKVLMKAHLLDQTEQEVWTLLGRVSLILGDLNKAEYYLNNAYQANPTSTTAKHDLAKLLLFLGKHHKITQLYSNILTDTSIATTLPSDLLLIIAQAYKERQQYDNALIILNELINLSPNDSYAFQLKASILGLQGKFFDAYKLYEKAIELDTNNFQAVIHIARLERAIGKPQQAIARLKSHLTKGDNSAVFIELGEAFESINDPKQASLYFEKALAHNPSSMLSLNKIVNSLVRNNNIAEAVTIVQNYLRKFDNKAEAYELASRLYYLNNQQSLALTSLEKAIKIATAKGEYLLKLAKLQLQLTQRTAAITSLQRALAWEAEYQPAYLLLIAIHTEDKAQDKALTLIQKLSELDTKAYLINQLKGDLYWALENDDKAKSYFMLSLQQQASKPTVLGLYRIYRKHQQYNEISALLSTWLKENPNDITSAISYAENFRAQGKLSQASDYYQQLLTARPNNILLLNNAALIEYQRDNLTLASSFINKAYELAPNNVNVIDTKAWIEVKRENYQQALSLLREANTLDYQNAEVKYHLAVTLDKIGRRNEGLAYLEAAVNSSQTFYEKADAVKLLATWQTN